MICVLDSNVLVSAMRSRLGASNELIRFLAGGKFRTAVSTALILEYDDVLHRPGMVACYTDEEIDSFINSF